MAQQKVVFCGTSSPSFKSLVDAKVVAHACLFYCFVAPSFPKFGRGGIRFVGQLVLMGNRDSSRGVEAVVRSVASRFKQTRVGLDAKFAFSRDVVCVFHTICLRIKNV